MADSERKPIKERHLFPVAAIAAVLLAVHLLSLALPGSRLWGINHLLYLPSLFTVLFLVLGVTALAMLVPPVRDIIGRLFAALAGATAERPPYGRWAVVAVFSMVGFWMFRLPLSLLGDGYSVMHNMSAKIPVVIKWSEMGAVSIVHFVSGFLPFTGLERGEYAYAIVSVISGGLTVFVFLALAHELTQNSGKRLFAFCLLVFSGWTLLFFGYTENYPVLWPAVAAYIYFSIRYLHHTGNLILPLVFLIVSIILHLQTVFLLISLPVLLAARGKGKTWYRRYRAVIWVALGVAFVVGAVAFIRTYRGSLPFRSHFVPPFSGRPLTPDYFLFSPSHLLDIVNQIMLLIPLWPLAFAFDRQEWKNLAGDAVARFLMAVSLGGAILLFSLEPKLGMARDWDLFALAGLGPMLLLIMVFLSSERWRIYFPGLALLALGLSLPFWAVNMSRPSTIAYFESLLRLDDRQSRPGMIVLRDYYYDTGDSTRGIALDSAIYRKFPAIRMARAAIELGEAGQFDQAMAVADSVYRINPYSSEGYNLKGITLLRAGRYEPAVKELLTSISLAEYDHRSWVNLALAYNRMGKRDEMMTALRRAQRLNPDDKNVLESLAMGFMSAQQMDSARVYGQRLLERDSTACQGFLAIGVSYLTARDLVRARQYLSKYVERAPESADRRQAVQLLQRIEKATSAMPRP